MPGDENTCSQWLFLRFLQILKINIARSIGHQLSWSSLFYGWLIIIRCGLMKWNRVFVTLYWLMSVCFCLFYIWHISSFYFFNVPLSKWTQLCLEKKSTGLDARITLAKKWGKKRSLIICQWLKKQMQADNHLYTASHTTTSDRNQPGEKKH